MSISTVMNQTARRNMLASQVRTNKIWDMNIVDAMDAIAREDFVPESYRGLAYMDEDIPLPNGRIVMEPMVAARLIQALKLDAEEDVVMEVATGMGFVSAVLSKLAKTIIAVESDETLIESIQTRLIDAGCENVVAMHAETTAGLGDPRSLNAIFINGAVEREPTELLDLLAENGRLVCVLVEGNQCGQTVLYTRFGESVVSQPLFDANVPLLPEYKAEKFFDFKC